jgi:L-gulono-1,4-lactone dehydrogenase
MGIGRDGTWRNWARNQVARPAVIEHPTSEDDLVRLVKEAAAAGQRVKVVGAGHSFTDAAVTDGRLVVLDRYARVLDVDTRAYRVTVEAGIVLSALNDELDRRGLAMPNLGDIAYQTVAGATSTGTHGTGATLRGLAAQIVAMRIVTADGSVIACDADNEAEVFHCARVGIGALGIVSTVTIQVVPAFTLRVLEEPMRVDALAEEIDEHIDSNDHFEFFWVPHTRWALTKRNNRTDDAAQPRPRWKELVDDYAMENIAFGAVCRLGRLRPSAIPRLARALPSQGQVTYSDKSYKVFASPRLVRFYEMEYSIPRPAAVEALNRVRKLVDDEGFKISFPVEVRFTAPDDIPLSTGYGEPRCYIAVHVFERMEYRRYFEGVESIMNDYGGRPHWGKLHFQTAKTLAPRYPEWSRFAAVRDRLDPERRFANNYTNRVLGL